MIHGIDRIWDNSWLVVGVPGGFAQHGDSGAAILLNNGRLLGHLVGVAGHTTFGCRQQAGIVQDIRFQLSAIDGGFGNTGVDIQVGMPLRPER